MHCPWWRSSVHCFTFLRYVGVMHVLATSIMRRAQKHDLLTSRRLGDLITGWNKQWGLALCRSPGCLVEHLSRNHTHQPFSFLCLQWVLFSSALMREWKWWDSPLEPPFTQGLGWLLLCEMWSHTWLRRGSLTARNEKAKGERSTIWESPYWPQKPGSGSPEVRETADCRGAGGLSSAFWGKPVLSSKWSDGRWLWGTKGSKWAR